jgi:CheY-like chemotaxis protein
MIDLRVLIVDDSPVDRELILEHLKDEDYELDTATDGAAAWQKLEADPHLYDVILLDRTMPRLDGIDLLRRIKGHPDLQALPVIMQTGLGDREEVLEGIRAGAHYYLVKPYDGEMLRLIVRAAATDYVMSRTLQGTVRKGLGSLRLMREARFRFFTVDHARDLGATLANACPDPEKTVVGLTELLVNAIEHGNLGITYEEKSALNAAGTWWQEVERRAKLPEFAGRFGEVIFERTDDELRFTIIDQGLGFDWRNFMQIDPARAFHTHGRGIAMANLMTFDSLEYRGSGSEVVGVIKTKP